MGLFNAFIASIDDQHRTAYKQGSDEDEQMEAIPAKPGVVAKAYY